MSLENLEWIFLNQIVIIVLIVSQKECFLRTWVKFLNNDGKSSLDFMAFKNFMI